MFLTESEFERSVVDTTSENTNIKTDTNQTLKEIQRKMNTGL